MRLRRAALFLTVLIGFGVLGVVGPTSVPGSLGGPEPAAAYPLDDGYWLAASDGGIFSFGDAQFFGSTGGLTLNKPIVGAAAHPFLEGYWLVASDGGIFAFGSSAFWGSLGNRVLNSPIVGMAATPTGLGYWLVAADGGIFAFGDAQFYGSTGGITLNKPIVGMAVTPTGGGYWLVATDGGIFAFGDARFFGSEGGRPLNKPIVGIAASASGLGYYLVASDGGIFTHGDAQFRGSRGGEPLNAPIVGMALSPSGLGYQFVATDGGIFNYGDSKFFGSTGNIRLNKPVLGMALRPRLAVKIDPYAPTAGQVSDWVQTGAGDWQLSLAYTSGTPAGARILGVEGLFVSQLGKLSYAVDTGSCAASGLRFVVAYDTNGDGTGDGLTSLPCTLGTTIDPVVAGIPGTAVVTGLDVVNSTGTIVIDDIVVAGISVADWQTYRAAA